jgi:mono/diheme cytochrome c family protein
MTTKWTICGALALVVVIVVPLASCAAPAIEPSATPSPVTFDTAAVARGAELAAIGDCATCHTAPGGRAYAGSRRIETPFGAMYSTNITPDRDTGIGRWSEAAFVRAMREGIDREGHRLYPVFPYDHFTIVSDDDLSALYAFLMTRTPVSATRPRNELAFPFGLRPLLAAWQLLYLHRQPFEPDPSQSAEWNRGKYLVEGLAHCGACHTPRNMLGAEKRDRAFAGGDAEGWHAPALDASSPAPTPWTRERLATYLRHDVVPEQGVPAGPMLPVAHDLSTVPNTEVQAIATYIATIAGAAPREGRPGDRGAEERGQPAVPATRTAIPNDAAHPAGRAIYVAACAVCHESGRGIGSAQAIRLADSTSLSLATPVNLLRIVEDGVKPPAGERGRWMPAFRGAFTDAQLADLARYLRTAFGRGGEWRDLDDRIRELRKANRMDVSATK